MATASMIIGITAGTYMLFIFFAILPVALSSLYPAGITLLVVAGLSLGILAITRGLQKGHATAARMIQSSLGILLCFVVMVVMGIATG
jgi:hypothetical protein